MGDGPENLFIQPLSEGHRPLSMTGCAEVTTLAGKGQQILMAAVGTSYAGESPPKIAVGQILPDSIPDDRTEKFKDRR